MAHEESFFDFAAEVGFTKHLGGMAAWVSQGQASSPRPLTSFQWQQLLESAGLSDIVVRTQAIETRSEARGMLQRYGFRGMLGIWWRMFELYRRSPAYRRFLKGLHQQGAVPKDVDKNLGYGLYVGRR